MKREIRFDSKLFKAIELFIDLFLVLAGFQLVIYIQDGTFISLIDYEHIRDLIFSNSFFLFTSFIFFRIFHTSVSEKGLLDAILSVFYALVLSNISAMVSVFLIPNFSYSRLGFLFTIWIQLFLIGVFKIILRKLLMKNYVKHAIIIGSTDDIKRLALKLIHEKGEYVNVKYIYQTKGKDLTSELVGLFNEVDYIFVGEDVHYRLKDAIMNFILSSKHKEMYIVPRIYEISLINSSHFQISDIVTFRILSWRLTTEQSFFKRSFDVFFSIIFLLITLPVSTIISIMIKAQDKGPIIFKQERVNREGNTFMIYKFRTMIIDAEKDTGPIQSTVNDERVTKLGKFLRKTRLDEMPQFINVLKGEMSIVGPRALRVEEVNEYIGKDSNYKYRSNVKPGVTGFAQTMGKYDTAPEDKLRLDLLYIRNYSFISDLKIIVYTFKTIINPTDYFQLRIKGSLQETLDKYHIDVTRKNAQLLILNKREGFRSWKS